MARREAIPSLHQSNLNPTRYGRLYIALPSLTEQRAIVLRIKASTITLDRSLATAEHEISLLREYRIRLIADVVTGKLDVREAAAQLPDEAGEQEPFNEAEPLTDNDETAEEDEQDALSEEAEA
jgi:type I restriction enzyme S subunit